MASYADNCSGGTTGADISGRALSDGVSGTWDKSGGTNAFTHNSAAGRFSVGAGSAAQAAVYTPSVPMSVDHGSYCARGLGSGNYGAGVRLGNDGSGADHRI